MASSWVTFLTINKQKENIMQILAQKSIKGLTVTLTEVTGKEFLVTSDDGYEYYSEYKTAYANQAEKAFERAVKQATKRKNKGNKTQRGNRVWL